MCESPGESERRRERDERDRERQRDRERLYASYSMVIKVYSTIQVQIGTRTFDAHELQKLVPQLEVRSNLFIYSLFIDFSFLDFRDVLSLVKSFIDSLQTADT